MKLPVRVLSLLLLLLPLPAFADAVSNFTGLGVNLRIDPNVVGDNVGGKLYGGSVNLSISGGTPYYWYNGSFPGYEPGSSGGGDTTFYFDDAFGMIGKHSYDDSSIRIQSADFFTGEFTFPTNGQDFTVTLPGSFGVIVLFTCGNVTCHTFNMTTNPGTLTLSFEYESAVGLYLASGGSFVSAPTTVPEPATLGLVALGIGSIVSRRRRRKSAPLAVPGARTL